MGHRRSKLASAAVALVAVLGAGCYSSGGKGSDPIDDGLYFPVGAALTTTGNFLVIANSDFDLAYNAGTIQAIDLASQDSKRGVAAATRACEQQLESADCLAPPESAPWNQCQAQLGALGCLGISSSPYVRASVRIGAFASDLKAVALYDDVADGKQQVPNASRVLVPVRGDATLTYVDAIDDTIDAAGNAHITFECYAGAGPDELGHACDPDHRVGQVPTADARQLTLEGEPFAIAVPSFFQCSRLDADGRCPLEPARSRGIAAIVHQDTGDVSVFHDVQQRNAPPVLAFALGYLALGATAIAPLDITAGVSEADPVVQFVPRFLVTNNTQASMFLVSYLGDDGNPDRSVLTASSLIPVPSQVTGTDMRGAVVDPPGPGESRATRVFLTSRSPASIVIGEVDTATGILHFYDSVPLPTGPSRIVRSSTLDANGIAHTRIYVIAYDTAYVIAYDPDARRVGNSIRTDRGPYSMAIDDQRHLGYLANFIDGTIEVIELDPKAHPALYEQVVFKVGIPQGPRT